MRRIKIAQNEAPTPIRATPLFPLKGSEKSNKVTLNTIKATAKKIKTVVKIFMVFIN